MYNGLQLLQLFLFSVCFVYGYRRFLSCSLLLGCMFYLWILPDLHMSIPRYQPQDFYTIRYIADGIMVLILASAMKRFQDVTIPIVFLIATFIHFLAHIEYTTNSTIIYDMYVPILNILNVITILAFIWPGSREVWNGYTGGTCHGGFMGFDDFRISNIPNHRTNPNLERMQ